MKPIKRSRLNLFALLLAGLLISCGGEAPPDPCCSYTEIPQGTEIKSGQGALMVQGTTEANFSIHNLDGDQVSYEKLNNVLAVDPGKYIVKVNSSTYPVTIKESMLSKCTTGAVVVKGDTDNLYSVIDSTGNQLYYEHLGKPLSFFASAPLQVRVNSSVAPLQIRLGETIEVQSGTLIVRGATDQLYQILDAQGQQLNYNNLEKPLSFLPGTYVVKVNDSKTSADVIAGKTTELITGIVLVTGLTEENYSVHDSTGAQLNYNNLNKPLSYLPGTYRVKVNGSEALATITSAVVTALQTGSIVVNGTASDNFHVLDAADQQLQYSPLNKPISFFSGEYTVRVGDNKRKASVSAGKATVLK